MQIIKEDGLVIKCWADELDEKTKEQALNLSRLPFAVHHIALMPDTHMGYGMPIGGVLATKGAVIPNAVGVDIGCGMCAAKTAFPADQFSTEEMKSIMGAIRRVVPVGFAHHDTPQPEDLMPAGQFGWIVDQQYQAALKQLGTLGGGNHFIELQKGSDGSLWVMIHSGSRNLGKQVADHYNKLAVELNHQWYVGVPEEWALAFLPIDNGAASGYLTEMRYCVQFAKANRGLMMDRVLQCLGAVAVERLDIAHNYAAQEHFYGQDLWIHRKGATRARAGELGIIPGSQGAKSYIVRGLGSLKSFNSCSHGAGRRMGRKQAERELDLQDEISRMDAKGILHGIRGKRDLDEAPGAYKDIDKVMSQQSDLVEIVTTLEPLAVIKG